MMLLLCETGGEKNKIPFLPEQHPQLTLLPVLAEAYLLTSWAEWSAAVMNMETKESWDA